MSEFRIFSLACWKVSPNLLNLETFLKVFTHELIIRSSKFGWKVVYGNDFPKREKGSQCLSYSRPSGTDITENNVDLEVKNQIKQTNKNREKMLLT